MFQIRRINAGEPFRFSVSRLPFYYGWVILIIGSLGILASVPGQTMGVSVFTDHLMDALGISRVGISSAYMAGTLASSLLIPFAGILFDRWGARITGALATSLLSLFLLLLAFSVSISQGAASLLNVPVAVAASVTVMVGFFGIRFFGQGMLTLVSRGMVAKWFGPRRGLVVGLMGLATAFGFSYAPQPLQQLIQRYGWQGALLAIASMLGIVFLPLVVLLYRADPSFCNLEVEQGMPTVKRKKRIQAEDAKVEKTAGEARKEPVYWVILAVMGYWSLFNTAFTFHIVSIFGEIGMDSDQAVRIFLPISVFSVVARFAGSYLSDRIAIKHIYRAFGMTLIVASLSLAGISSPVARMAAIASYGIGSGLFGMLNIVTWPKLYGRKHLGAISGFAMSTMVAGSAVGPWLFSLSHQSTGSYRSAGLLGVLVSVIFLVVILVVRFPEAPKIVCLNETGEEPRQKAEDSEAGPCPQDDRKIG